MLKYLSVDRSYVGIRFVFKQWCYHFGSYHFESLTRSERTRYLCLHLRHVFFFVQFFCYHSNNFLSLLSTYIITFSELLIENCSACNKLFAILYI